MLSRRHVIPLLIVCAAITLFAFFQSRVTSSSKRTLKADEELSVVLPRTVQLLMAGGDRFLAANIGAFRAVVTGTHRLKDESYLALAQVQTDVAWLNPGHEDNYYTAAAILPWVGQVAPAQTILGAAIDARRHDDMPAFFWAFNQMNFLGDTVAAADALRAAANRSTRNQSSLMLMASRWYQRGADPGLAARMTRLMADQTRHPPLKQRLLERAELLDQLGLLREAAQKFQAERGALPKKLGELAPYLPASLASTDLAAKGFDLPADGVPRLRGR